MKASDVILTHFEGAVAYTTPLEVGDVVVTQIQCREVLESWGGTDAFRHPEASALFELLDVLHGLNVGLNWCLDPHGSEHGHFRVHSRGEESGYGLACSQFCHFIICQRQHDL